MLLEEVARKRRVAYETDYNGDSLLSFLGEDGLEKGGRTRRFIGDEEEETNDDREAAMMRRNSSVIRRQEVGGEEG